MGAPSKKPVTERKRVNERFKSRTNLSVCGRKRAMNLLCE
jgi:hypothetical protein